jgi:hypothetical protein
MPAVSISRYMVQAGWDDVPHLSERAKADILRSTPPHMREARRTGAPSLGSGAIYPIPFEEIEVAPFAIPAHWKRAYGLDVGYKCTAAVWAAKDPADGTTYLYAEHCRNNERPATHAMAIQARGDWINGAIDPASRGRQQTDGKQLIMEYRQLGLRIIEADNAVEAGLFNVYNMLSTGRLKVFRTLSNFKAEYRLYRRDKNGKVVKEFDHCMDAARYVIQTWDRVARHMPATLVATNHTMIGDRAAGL